MGMAKALVVGLGSILAIAGTAIAVTIGPDDWLDSASTVVNGDGHTAVTTQYGLVSLTTPVRVRARSESGEVFIGAGHVIDVEDYLGDASRVTITGFSPLSVSSAADTGASGSLPAEPSGLDFWRQQASGGGTQEVSGSFGGEPVVFVISTPDGQPAAMSVSLGIKTPAGFAIGLGTGLVGLALIALGVFVGRRRRPEAAGGPAVPSGSIPPPPPPPPFNAPPMPPAPPGGGSAARRVALLAVLGAVLVSATACSGTPLANPLSAPPPNRADVTIDPATDLDLNAVAADYDRRNNAAIRASLKPTFSTKGWASADAEPYLGVDRFETAWNRAKGNGWDAASDVCLNHVDAAFRNPAKAYPLALFTVGTFACGQHLGAPPPTYRLYSRANSWSPWLLIDLADVNSPEDVKVLPGDVSITPDQQQAGTEAAQAFATLMKTGSSKALKMPSGLAKWYKKTASDDAGSTASVTGLVVPGSVVTVAADKGTLTHVSFGQTSTWQAKPGHYLYWQSPYDKIYKQTAHYQRMSEHYLVTAVIQITDGKASVIAWAAQHYLP